MRRGKLLADIATYVVLSIGGAVMMTPLLWMVSTSLKHPSAAGAFPPEFIPRLQQTVRDPETGQRLPVFLARMGGRSVKVARVKFAKDAAVVRILEGARAGEIVTLPLYDQSGQPRLKPVKRLYVHWRNYPDAWHALRLQRPWMAFAIGPLRFRGFAIRDAFLAFYLNSIIVTVIVTAGCVFTSSLAGYAFARLKFPARDALFLGYLATLMVPHVVTMIPVFILLRWLRLIDTYSALILPAMFSAYGTFMLRQFFLSIPRELEDAARIDGCGSWGVYRHVILPLSKPALATLAVFIFLWTWNSFMWPLIVINSTEKMPLMLGLYAFMGPHSAEWHLLMAASVMVMAPVIMVFVVAQKYFVRGIMLTGLKT